MTRTTAPCWVRIELSFRVVPGHLARRGLRFGVPAWACSARWLGTMRP